MDRDDDFLMSALNTLARWDRSCPPGPERDRVDRLDRTPRSGRPHPSPAGLAITAADAAPTAWAPLTRTMVAAPRSSPDAVSERRCVSVAHRHRP